MATLVTHYLYRNDEGDCVFTDTKDKSHGYYIGSLERPEKSTLNRPMSCHSVRKVSNVVFVADVATLGARYINERVYNDADDQKAGAPRYTIRRRHICAAVVIKEQDPNFVRDPHYDFNTSS